MGKKPQTNNKKNNLSAVPLFGHCKLYFGTVRERRSIKTGGREEFRRGVCDEQKNQLS